MPIRTHTFCANMLSVSKRQFIDYSASIVLISACSLMLAQTALACDPAVVQIGDLLRDADTSIVKGRFYSAPTSGAAQGAVFIATQTYRGKIGPGEYQVAEGGPFGNHCEYSEMQIGYPTPDPRPGFPPTLPPGEDQYLFVSKISDNNTLVVPIGWSYGVMMTAGRVTFENCSTSAKNFEALLRAGTHIEIPSAWCKADGNQ